jgi:hypothetical protein
VLVAVLRIALVLFDRAVRSCCSIVLFGRADLATRRRGRSMPAGAG